ncbi:hypothetical protein ACQ4PT_057339 [Festuca glaucescens]
MAKAIPKIFPRTLHKFCRWHIMNKHKDPLKKLYKLFPDLKDQLTAILNHPLMPSEFEDAWKALIAKYNLHDINVMINLWAERKLWISAYWKEVFCARMTSTQRSESMNFVLKRGFVTEQDNLHIFAKQVNNCVQARHETKNAETNASTVYGPTASSGNIKVHIRNLLARQHIPETEDEDMLDTDEGECFEDETDDDEYENNDEDEDISEQEETHTTPDVDNKLESVNKKEGQRKCSVCNLRQGHYASTCPYKDKILQQKIDERQTSDSEIVKPQG